MQTGEEEWRLFTPDVIKSGKCLARTWNQGRGGQCTNKLESGRLCKQHLKCGSTHGDVDGPIPPAKLAEFHNAAILFERRCRTSPAKARDSNPVCSASVRKRKRLDEKSSKRSDVAKSSSSSTTSSSSSDSSTDIPSLRPAELDKQNLQENPFFDIVKLTTNIHANDANAKLMAIRAAHKFTERGGIDQLVNAGVFTILVTWVNFATTCLMQPGQPQVILEILQWWSDTHFTLKQLARTKIPLTVRRIRQTCPFAKDLSNKILAAWIRDYKTRKQEQEKTLECSDKATQPGNIDGDMLLIDMAPNNKATVASPCDESAKAIDIEIAYPGIEEDASSMKSTLTDAFGVSLLGDDRGCAPKQEENHSPKERSVLQLLEQLEVLGSIVDEAEAEHL